jgi:hypothetical protein
MAESCLDRYISRNAPSRVNESIHVSLTYDNPYRKHHLLRDTVRDNYVDAPTEKAYTSTNYLRQMEKT